MRKRRSSSGSSSRPSAGLVGAPVLLLTGPLLARVSLSFKFFSLATLGLLTCALVNGPAPARGFVSLLLARLVATVGLDLTARRPRFTFGSVEPTGGVSFTPVMIGMFAFPEILCGFTNAATGTGAAPPDTGRVRPCRGMGALPGKHPFPVPRGTAPGSTIGALPGVGGDLAAWIG